MIIDVIHKARFELRRNNVPTPYVVRLSTVAHDLLVAEMRQRDGLKRTRTRVFEILDMKVEIDPLCPQRGAYIMGGESK